MYYGQLYDADTANGPGMRVTLFVSGCDFHCPNCFNECAWDYEYGTRFTSDTVKKVLDMVDRPYIRGLTILGGEPLAPKNRENVAFLTSSFRSRFGNTKDLWIYTGYTFEELLDIKAAKPSFVALSNILRDADILVDGRFVEAEKDITLKFRGSRNQRILNIHDSLLSGQAVWDENWR